MTARYVLYFTAAGHTLYRRSRWRLSREAGFSADEAGLAAFRAALRARPKSTYYIVPDVAGEEFHEEQIPYLRGADRRAVVERRILQRVRDARVAAALSLGTVVGERREERLLLASFADTQQFVPWLDAIAESGARLAGMYSTALLAPALASALRARAARCLIVTVDRAGLRQSYLEGGRLRFSRLEPVADRSVDALARLVRSETVRLAAYLVTLRVLPRQAPPLRVLVVAPPGAKERFEQILTAETQLDVQTFDAQAAARAAHARLAPDEPGAERLFVELAVRKTPSAQFVRREERRGYLLWKLQRAIVAVGAAGFAACALYAGVLWLEASAVRGSTSVQRGATQFAEARYQRIMRKFPVTQTTPDNLKLTVTVFRGIVARSSTPETSLVQLSSVLDRFPHFVLDSLDWRVGTLPEQAAPGAPVVEGGARPAPESGTKRPPAEIIQLSGRITATSRASYRAVTAQLDRFTRALEALPGYRLVLTRLPFDISPQGTLSGGGESGAPARAGDDSTPFTVVVSRRLE